MMMRGRSQRAGDEEEDRNETTQRGDEMVCTPTATVCVDVVCVYSYCSRQKGVQYLSWVNEGTRSMTTAGMAGEQL